MGVETYKGSMVEKMCQSKRLCEAKQSNQTCSSSLKGPPPALEGPLAVNTRLQKGHRLFVGKLHGPESFTADEEGEHAVCYVCNLHTHAYIS